MLLVANEVCRPFRLLPARKERQGEISIGRVSSRESSTKQSDEEEQDGNLEAFQTKEKSDPSF